MPFEGTIDALPELPESNTKPVYHFRPSCAFCAAELEQVELMFVSRLGGLPPAICSGCIERNMGVLEAHRIDPEATSNAIAAASRGR